MAGSVGSEDGDIGFQIAPMVDVVFVLMLFFMACAGSQVVTKELNVNLPSGPSAPGSAPSVTPIVIEVSGDGVVSMNSTSYGQANDKNLSALRDWLKNAIETFGSEDPVIIRPTPDAKHERIVDVLNAAAASGVKNLTFS
jgi:biopolymer transport protein ExbD